MSIVCAGFREFNEFCRIHVRLINWADRFIVASRLDSPDELYRYCFTTFLWCRNMSRVLGSDNCMEWFMHEWLGHEFAHCCYKIYARFICAFCDTPVTFIIVASRKHNDDTYFPSFVMTSKNGILIVKLARATIEKPLILIRANIYCISCNNTKSIKMTNATLEFYSHFLILIIKNYWNMTTELNNCSHNLTKKSIIYKLSIR